MSYSSFSQTVTDSTKIVLTKPVAKLVIQDIVVGDQLKIQLKTTEELLNETNNKLETQSLLVFNLESQVDNYKSMILEEECFFLYQLGVIFLLKIGKIYLYP